MENYLNIYNYVEKKVNVAFLYIACYGRFLQGLQPEGYIPVFKCGTKKPLRKLTYHFPLMANNVHFSNVVCRKFPSYEWQYVSGTKQDNCNMARAKIKRPLPRA